MLIILLMCVAQIMSSLYGPSAVTNMQHAKVRDIWHWLLIFISLEGEAGHRVLKRWIYPNISQFESSWTKHAWLYINIQYIWNYVFQPCLKMSIDRTKKTFGKFQYLASVANIHGTCGHTGCLALKLWISVQHKCPTLRWWMASQMQIFIWEKQSGSFSNGNIFGQKTRRYFILVANKTGLELYDPVNVTDKTITAKISSRTHTRVMKELLTKSTKIISAS